MSLKMYDFLFRIGKTLVKSVTMFAYNLNINFLFEIRFGTDFSSCVFYYYFFFAG